LAAAWLISRLDCTPAPPPLLHVRLVWLFLQLPASLVGCWLG